MANYEVGIYLTAFGIMGIIAAFPLTGGCTVESHDVKRIVEQQSNVTYVQSQPYRYWACGKGDSFNAGFIAKNDKGETVTGVVCGGFFKAYTVRFD